MDRSPDQRLAVALARALAQAGVKEEDLAAKLGVKQPTVNRWVNAERSIQLRLLPLIDEACGQPLGHLLRLAGYVSEDVDVEAAISNDDTLDEAGKEVLLLAYEYCRRTASPKSMATVSYTIDGLAELVPDMADEVERTLIELPEFTDEQKAAGIQAYRQMLETGN